MSADEFTSLVAEATFVLLGVVTVARAIRMPRQVKTHTAVFFSLIAAIVIVGWGQQLELIDQDHAVVTVLTQSLLVALPYPLLLLAGDFTGTSRIVRRAAEAALFVSIAGLVVLRSERKSGV